MANNASKITINLTGKPKEKFESVFYKWVVNSGKIIIVITELIALGALFFRFSVDKQIVDLHDTIAREQLFLNGQQSKEKEYRGIQGRLAAIKTVTADAADKLGIINFIISSQNANTLPTISLTINEDTIGVAGTTVSIYALNNFINSLKARDKVSSISLDQITTSDQGIQFKMTILVQSNSI